MAEGKKSFILYLTQRPIFEGLSDEDAGKLIKTVFAYVSDENPTPEGLIGYSFNIIKPLLKNDLREWEDIKLKRAEAGRLGGIARANNLKQNQANVANAKSDKQNQANQAVNVNVNDNVNVNVLDKSNINKVSKDTMSSKLNDACSEIIDYLNLKTGKNFKSNSKATKTLIQARLKDGYTVDEFKKVIDNKVYHWTGTEQEQYLRPETLFRPSHFESYLNEEHKSKVKNNPCDLPNGGFESLDDYYLDEETIKENEEWLKEQKF